MWWPCTSSLYDMEIERDSARKPEEGDASLPKK